jgi:periplasmic protein TonB
MTERIVDVVFERNATRGRDFLSVALAVAIVLHGAVLVWAARTGPSIEQWAAEIALVVHDDLAKEDVVTLEPERAEPPPAKKAIEAAPTTLDKPTAARAPVSAAPAAAPAVMTAEDEGPVDLSQNTIVSGTARSTPGGAVHTEGTRTEPAPAQAGAPDQSSRVTLEHGEWSCAWPNTAAGDVTNEQSVLIKVEVDGDGRVLDAKIVRDARRGFGEAAIQCAKRTRFVPAKDGAGRPLRAWSPPIEVRFFR